MQLQQVKIMFTLEASHDINAACKGLGVPPLDHKNQRVFNDVLDHGFYGDFYTVKLNSGESYSYPSRNIERIRHEWREDELTSEQVDIINRAVNDIYNEEIDIEVELDLVLLTLLLNMSQGSVLILDCAEIDALLEDEDIARLYRR